MRYYVLASLLVLAAVLTLAYPNGEGAVADLKQGKPVAEITSPRHHDNVPRQGIDPPCNPAFGCSRITVEGTITPGYWPFVAVAPQAAAPRMWIQPRVSAVRKSGSFESLAYLGTAKEGIGERFTIYVLGSTNDKRFREGDTLEEVPKDCIVSEPVTVTRAK